MSSALANKTNDKPLSKAQSEWPAIKKETIADYEEGFKQAMLSLKKKQ